MARPVRVSDALWRRIEAIDGWLYREEADLLADLVAGRWCEVGAWHGKSAVVLAESGFPGWVVDWMIEGNEGGEELRANLADYPSVRLLANDFRKAADLVPAGLQFLHLDADHSYEGTAEAFDLYAPKVERGGYVVIHDAWWLEDEINVNPWPGVTAFVEDLIDEDGEWMHVRDALRSAAFIRR